MDTNFNLSVTNDISLSASVGKVDPSCEKGRCKTKCVGFYFMHLKNRSRKFRNLCPTKEL